MAELTLRPGRSDDADRVFAWRNDPSTRAVSFQSDPISYPAHVAWFARELESEGHHLFIVESDGEPIGVLRLDRSDDPPDACSIAVHIAPHVQGRGLGTRALRAATPVAADLGFRRIVALIRPENAASIRAFEKAGYQREKSTDVSGQPAARYVLAP